MQDVFRTKVWKRSVKAWIPVDSVGRFHPDRRKLLDEFTPLFFEQLPAALKTLRPEITNPTVRSAKPPKAINDALVQSTWLARFADFVEISADVEVDVQELKRINDGKKLELNLFKYIAADMLGSAIDVAILLSELAYPSCIDVDKGRVCIGRTMYVETPKKSGFFSLQFPEEHDIQWPTLHNIDLVTVVKWAQARGIMERELALTPIERALAAYTQVIRLSPMNRGEGLFRAMQGLEALYCEGTGDLRRQLSEKSKLWLGNWSDKKNIVGQLYDWRSKFLHGAAGVTYATGMGSSWEEDESTAVGLQAAETFAVRLLIASLQRCIVDDIAEIGWTYAIREK